MHALVLAVLATVASSRRAPDAVAYEKARQSFYALKANSQKRKDRKQWLGAAARFEAVSAKYPASALAAQALYTAAELRSELSRLPLAAVADRRVALADYRKVAASYPASDLADDALYQAARIELDRENDPEAARADLKTIVKRYPKGDRLRHAKALLATLGPEPKKAVAKKERFKIPVAPEPKAEVAARAPAAPLRGDAGTDGFSPAPPPDQMLRPLASARQPAEPASSSVSKGVAALQKAGAAPGGVPLAVQMGLNIRRVVIDPGHGGHDTGAIGPGGTQEKDVTLAIALKLATELRAKGLEVILTRDTDRFVPLEGRAQLANDQKADLFISVHANANTDRKQHGVETYFLDVTNDRYAIRLAAMENQASERNISDLQLILADLATKSNVQESHDLASRVQRSLVEDLGDAKTPERDLGVKHALFYVLLGVKMPAILVESAFVSNPEEEKRLSSAPFQESVAKDIANGVDRFMRDRRELAGL